MELRHLRSFQVLAEELHFGRAAARLGIEQSPLSRQIKELEEEFGLQLFHRTTRATFLSAAGEELLPHARRILDDVDLTKQEIGSAGSANKRLRIGLAEGFFGAPLGALLRHLEAEPTDVRTTVVERPITDLLGMLTVGTIDAIFAPEQASTSDTVSAPAWTEPMVAIVPPSLAGGVTSVGELGLPLFLPDPLSLPGLSRQTLAPLAERLPIATSRFDKASTLYALVGTGLGIGLLPRSLTISSERTAVRPLRCKRARITFWLTTRRIDDTPAVAILLEAVRAGAARAAPPRRADHS